MAPPDPLPPHPLTIHRYRYHADNWGAVIRSANGACSLVDAGDAGAARRALQKVGGTLQEIWITHHHGDHTNGVATLVRETGCSVRGPGGCGDPPLAGGTCFAFCGQTVCVMATPGHTSDMLSFYLPQQQAVFTGDTLFALGCGRLFEGSPADMYRSLNALAALPVTTRVYSGHDYALKNADFAAGLEATPPAAVARRLRAIQQAGGETDQPPTIGIEKISNPFLRTADPVLQAALRLPGSDPLTVFTVLRRRRDAF